MVTTGESVTSRWTPRTDRGAIERHLFKNAHRLTIQKNPMGNLARSVTINGLPGRSASHFPHADLWGGIASGLRVTREQFSGEPMKRLLVCVSR